MTGRVHSIQTLGTLDGPGVRFVVFLQGCPLRCHCCHNPDTWDFSLGKEMSAEEIVLRACRYREYFGNAGGITVSGGEPLVQADFVHEIFSLCHAEGINTCLDTSGCILNESVLRLLSVTDRVRLDVKYTSDREYLDYVGCSFSSVIRFLECLEEKKIATTLRQVIIPDVNDSQDSVKAFAELKKRYSTVDSAELLPFRKLCDTKYRELGIPFLFGDKREPTSEETSALSALL